MGASDTRSANPNVCMRNDGRFGDRIKMLTWDGTGLVLAYKRLEEGRFSWPAIHDGVMRLSRAQFEALFDCAC